MSIYLRTYLQTVIVNFRQSKLKQSKQVNLSTYLFIPIKRNINSVLNEQSF